MSRSGQLLEPGKPRITPLGDNLTHQLQGIFRGLTRQALPQPISASRSRSKAVFQAPTSARYVGYVWRFNPSLQTRCESRPSILRSTKLNLPESASLVDSGKRSSTGAAPPTRWISPSSLDVLHGFFGAEGCHCHAEVPSAYEATPGH